MDILIKITSSSALANIVLLITAIIAVRTYRSDVQQKKIKNTHDYIEKFLEGNWILKDDKLNWNKFFTKRLCRYTEGQFSLNGKYISYRTVKDGIFTKEESFEEDIINIFSEGVDEMFGRSISNILQMLEFIANKVNKKELDIDIIRIRLFRFYQMADYYNDILAKSEVYRNNIPYPNIKQLNKELNKIFGVTIPIGEYCEFPITK